MRESLTGIRIALHDKALRITVMKTIARYSASSSIPRSDRDGRPAGDRWSVNCKISLGVALRIRVPANSEGMTSLVFWRQSLSSSARSFAMASALSDASGPSRLCDSVGSSLQVVEFARGTWRLHEWRDGLARRAFGDVPRQVEQRPGRIVLDVAVFLGAYGADRIERIVVRLGRVDLSARRRRVPVRRLSACEIPSISAGASTPSRPSSVGTRSTPLNNSS